MKSAGRISSLFAGVAILLIAGTIFTFVMGGRVIRSLEQSARLNSALVRLAQLTITLQDAETGQRGYVLTGDPIYLAPFDRAEAVLPRALSDVEALAGSGVISTHDFASLEDAVKLKMTELRQTIELRRDHGYDAALAVVKTDSGRQYMVRAEALVGMMTEQITSAIADEKERSSDANQYRTATFIGATLISLSALLFAFVRILQAIDQNHRASEEMREQKELLSVTLASIGDAVIVTDRMGMITFMNRTAVDLTGWSVKDALGAECRRIFNIISESSRQPVESPVDKVLRLGTVVGLANHTMLIRRDAQEVPIDDSGAPIRGADGTLHGVVLVFRDFTNYKATEQKLIESRNAFEQASKAKDQFLATLSHELRTPLTPVLATLSIWENGTALPANLLAAVRMMRRNVELEARLIDDLLDLTRIAKGKMPTNLEVVDVHNLLHNAMEMYASDIRSKRIKVTSSLAAVEHYVTADPARLAQVFWNILKNATKFTPEGGTVDISTRSERGGKIVISVADNGIGMTEELLGRLFQPFEQGDAALVRRMGGLGLGMALTKALLDIQGGEISAESAGENQGSTFSVRLRTVLQGITKPEPAPLPKVGDGRRRMKILLVEDHADSAEVLQQVLISFGHDSTVASTVADALKEFDNNDFDVLISDIGLPDGTGLDLIRQVRPKFTKPAIALTGFGMEDDINRCMEAGFTAHLVKPVDMRKLATALASVTKAN